MVTSSPSSTGCRTKISGTHHQPERPPHRPLGKHGCGLVQNSSSGRTDPARWLTTAPTAALGDGRVGPAGVDLPLYIYWRPRCGLVTGLLVWEGSVGGWLRQRASVPNRDLVDLLLQALIRTILNL